MSNWFVNIGGKNIGPTTAEEIVSQLRAGQIDASTMVWKEGLTAWISVSSSELAALIEPQNPSIVKGSVDRISPLALVPPPMSLKTNAHSMPTLTSDPPIVVFLNDLSRASLADKLMLGCQTIALIFFLIASFKCLDSDLVLSRGFGIFLMGHTFMIARGVIGTVCRLLIQNTEKQSAGESHDKRAA